MLTTTAENVRADEKQPQRCLTPDLTAGRSKGNKPLLLIRSKWPWPQTVRSSFLLANSSYTGMPIYI
jgi:hypothetical protein